VADDKPDPYNEGQFQTGENTGVYSTGSGQTGDPNLEDYQGWDWKQLKAAVVGYAASNDETANLNAAGNVDPSTLRYAGEAFQHAHDTMSMIATSLRAQAQAVAGENGPWSGAGAKAFLAKMETLAEHIEQHAERIAGGDSGSAGNSVPSQLHHSGNVLAWAQNRLNYIDNYYAGWARKLGADVVDGLTYISQIDGLPERMTADMRVVVGELAEQYKVTFSAVQQPEGINPDGDTPEGPPDLNDEGPPDPDEDDIPDPDEDDVPDPTADDVPDPTADDVPDPTADDIPDPTADDVPDPTADDVPDPTADAIPDPTADAIPDPTATDIPDPAGQDLPGAGDLPNANDIPPPSGSTGPGFDAPGANNGNAGVIPPLTSIPPVSTAGNDRPKPSLPTAGEIPEIDKSGPGAGGASGGVPDPTADNLPLPAVDDPTAGLPGGGGLPGGVGGGAGGGLGAGGIPPVSPSQPPQGSSPQDRSDASGLLGEVEEPWKPGGGVGDPTGGASPGLGAGGIPPVSPSQPPQGSSPQDRSDASGLLGEVEQPWNPAVGGVGDPTGGAAPGLGAGGIPPLSPAQAPQGSSAPDRSDASGLLGEVAEPWQPAGNGVGDPTGGAASGPGAGGIPPISPAQAPQGSSASERSDASGLLGDVAQPWQPAGVSGSPQVPVGGVPPVSPAQAPQGSSASERSDASGLLGEVAEPWQPAGANGSPQIPAGGVPPLAPGQAPQGSTAPERSDASGLLEETGDPWQGGEAAVPGPPAGGAAPGGTGGDVTPVDPFADFPPVGAPGLVPLPVAPAPRREAPPGRPDAAELLEEQAEAWNGVVPTQSAGPERDARDGSDGGDDTTGPHDDDYVPIVRRDEAAEDTSAWGGDGAAWNWPFGGAPSTGAAAGTAGWGELPKGWSGLPAPVEPAAAPESHDDGPAHATWRPARVDPGEPVTVEALVAEVVARDGQSGGIRPLSPEELEARARAREERRRQEMERLTPPPPPGDDEDETERSAGDLLRQDDDAWGSGRSAPGVIG
jgi:hypothetical protein